MNIRQAFLSVLFIAMSSLWASGQMDPSSVKATLCDLYQNPIKFVGKMVSVRGRVTGNDLWIDDFTQGKCPSWTKVILVFPEQTKPAAKFDFVRDDSFKAFLADLHAGMSVDATFEGRFDAVFTWRDHKQILVDPSQEKGFGKKHDAGARIVLRSVSDVVARPSALR